MKSALPLILAATACQTAPVPAQAPPGAEACSLTVRFGSYAMGIDSSAAAAVDKALAGNRDVKGVSRSGWGREGEYTLCVTARDAAASGRLFDTVAALLPRQPRGPISVEGAGRRVEAPRR
jgi:hypothetical protein